MVHLPTVEPSPASPEAQAVVGRPAPTWADRAVALVEVGLSSDVPTQVLSGAALTALGLTAVGADGRLRIGFVAPMLAIDSVLLIALILLLLRLHGEAARAVFFGHQRWLEEAKLAVPAALGALAMAATVLILVQTIAPWLHTVDRNPFEGLVTGPANAAVFAVVGIVGGGVREELQRAFVLRRFEQYLGGRGVGVVVSSVAFGAGHLLQGADAGIATGVLGAFWGLLYLRRGSVVAPVLSHAAFNTLQIGAFFVSGR